MKEKIKKFLNENGRLAILILFILELFLTIFITPNKYDDEYFIEQVTNKSIWSFVGPRYYWWSSRIIIEFVLCLVLKISKYAWILIEALMVALAGYSISKVFIKDNKNDNTMMLIFMILLYPLDIMASAGWAATTVNYMWPLATGLFALIPIRKMWDGEKIKIYEYPLYTIALLFAGNAEQSCAILVGAYVLFAILMILKNKKIHPYMVIQTLIIIASLVFVLTCPGNHARNAVEIERHFKDIEMLSMLDKISLGLTSTIGLIIGKGNIIYALLSILVAVYICTNYKEKLYKVVSVIPLVSVVVCYFTLETTVRFFPFLGFFNELLAEEQVMLTAANCNNFLYTLPLIFAFVNFISLGVSILLIFKNLKNNVAIIVFLAGLASRIIMGFSPTVFISGERTMIFFEFAMIIVSILIWQELIKKNDKNDIKTQKKVATIIKGAGVLQYISMLLCILITQK